MKPVHAALTALFLVACTSEDPDASPPESPALDLVLARSSQGSTSLRVYFEQPEQQGCDANDFVQPGELRQDDDVYNPCPIATCVSELRLVRGDEIVEAARIDPQAPGAFLGKAGETGLELEILGCGAPRRLPLWDNDLPLESHVTLEAGDPVRIVTDMPSDRVSLLSVSSAFPLQVSRHSEAGASSVGVLVDGRSSFVTVEAVERGEESDLDGLRVARWSSVTLLSGELSAP